MSVYWKRQTDILNTLKCWRYLNAKPRCLVQACCRANLSVDKHDDLHSEKIKFGGDHRRQPTLITKVIVSLSQFLSAQNQSQLCTALNILLPLFLYNSHCLVSLDWRSLTKHIQNPACAGSRTICSIFLVCCGRTCKSCLLYGLEWKMPSLTLV